MNEVIGAILIGVGVLFDFLGTMGLLRMPDVYTRLQAATKCVTLGTLLILIGAAVLSGFDADGLRAIVCAAFVLVTAPVGAHALAKGAYLSGIAPVDAVVDRYAERQED